MITIVHIVGPGEHCELERCLVCKWRLVEEGFACGTCRLQLVRMLIFIERSIPLVEAAVSIPTAAGGLNVDLVDLTEPGNQVRVEVGDDQIGHVAVARRLAPWFEAWSGRDVLFADAASVARQLRRSLTWACASEPQIDVFAREVRQAYAALRVALKRDLRPRSYSAPCRWCDQRALARRWGADWIECECGALYDEQDYADLVVMQLERAARDNWAAGRALTTREAAALAGVTMGVIRQWTHRKKIFYDIGPWGGRRYLRIVVDWAQAEIENRQREAIAA